METVGIRILKSHLSQYIRKAKAGETIIVTEHGQEVAELTPISKERLAVHQLASEQRLRWSGNKPTGCKRIAAKGTEVAETVLEERR